MTNVLNFPKRPPNVKFLPFLPKPERKSDPENESLCILAIVDITDPSEPERDYALGYWLGDYSIWVNANDFSLIDEYTSKIVTHYAQLEEPIA